MEASIRGIIKAVCISEKKGTEKHPVNEIVLKENFGIEGDAHAGKWHRQVSLLSAEKVDEFNARGGDAAIGAFGENILVSGIDFKKLLVGSIMRSGEVVMKLTQIGKECHSHCTIFARVGDCIMPREGVFATVEHGGVLRSGMELEVTLPAADAPLRAAVMTLSDKGAAGERVDTSGPRAAELLAEAGYEIVEQVLLPDAQKKIERELMRLADSRQVDLIITTGGTRCCTGGNNGGGYTQCARYRGDHPCGIAEDYAAGNAEPRRERSARTDADCESSRKHQSGGGSAGNRFAAAGAWTAYPEGQRP